MKDDCPFCKCTDRIILDKNRNFFSVRDLFPISKAHTLIIPKRHIDSIFNINQEELLDLYEILKNTKEAIDKEHSPSGYNVGINDGESAGQTIFHLHIHVIPRYKGDSEDPRGGIRWIFPEKAKYWP